jgi:predicted nucleic acid-binding protein
MNGLYVIDTNGIIGYFDHVFEAPANLSMSTRSLIERALSTSPQEVKLSIPSIVFVEIFEKWLDCEEMAAKFHYEVFNLLARSPNIEIKPVEQEVLENMLEIRGTLADHEIHDKIILASAMMLNCSIITTDPKIREYVEVNGVIPSVIS